MTFKEIYLLPVAVFIIVPVSFLITWVSIFLLTCENHSYIFLESGKALNIITNLRKRQCLLVRLTDMFVTCNDYGSRHVRLFSRTRAPNV
jgi:hypothetical protein